MHIGIDIEQIEKFENFTKDKMKFLQPIFSASELKFCSGQQNPAKYLTLCFSAKEAFLKAFSSIDKNLFSISDINLDFSNKIPELKFSEPIQKWFKKQKIDEIKFTFSIKKKYVVALIAARKNS